MVDDVPSLASHTSKLPDRGTEVILLAKEFREILAARFCRHITDSKRSGERQSSVYQVPGEWNLEILYGSHGCRYRAAFQTRERRTHLCSTDWAMVPTPN